MRLKFSWASEKGGRLGKLDMIRMESKLNSLKRTERKVVGIRFNGGKAISLIYEFLERYRKLEGEVACHSEEGWVSIG